ncbi:hypothetical protein Tco_0247527 [Tanacetum coccineum]
MEGMHGQPVLWEEDGESSLIGPELVQEMTDKLVLRKEKLKAGKLHRGTYRKLWSVKLRVVKRSEDFVNEQFIEFKACYILGRDISSKDGITVNRGTDAYSIRFMGVRSMDMKDVVHALLSKLLVVRSCVYRKCVDMREKGINVVEIMEVVVNEGMGYTRLCSVYVYFANYEMDCCALSVTFKAFMDLLRSERDVSLLWIVNSEGNGQKDELAPSDGHFFYDVKGIDSAYKTQYGIHSNKDAGTDDDDDDFLADEENEWRNVDVINADGFDSNNGNDNKTSNYKRRRLAELSREMKGVINVSGQWKSHFTLGRNLLLHKRLGTILHAFH